MIRMNMKTQDETPLDDTFEKMLKDFSKKVRKEGIIEEVKRRQFYTKPSAAKRLRKNGRPKRSL